MDAQIPPSGVHIARQPIFDADLEVTAYELLYRATQDATNATSTAGRTTVGVLFEALFSVGLDRLTAGKIGYANFPHELLVAGYAELLDPRLIGIEIMPDVTPDPDVVSAVMDLRDRGVTVVLDDVAAGDSRFELLPFVDGVKIDFAARSTEERAVIAETCAFQRVPMTGMRLEDESDVSRARTLGCSRFQGYFFAKPEIVPGSAMSPNHVTQLRLLRQVSQPVIDVDEIEAIVRRDVAMSYKLLRYINSAAFGWKHEIDNVRQALVLLGETDVRRWMTLVTMSEMASGSPLELAEKSVIRGRMFEILAPMLSSATRAADYFFLGMLSHIDALLAMPMEEAIADLALAPDVRSALLRQGGATPTGSLLALADAYERGDWDVCSAICARVRVPETAVAGAYLEGLDFGRTLAAA